ncbi:Rab family GTPase [Tupanvirus deep ocean]|uniref:Rab family GTPase n=2 Tax=Tupanvirus TaxID=2094720 RepID=A0AC62A9M6_9VIRU|nr:Rab family GTPase [Tupanvirus deep ocean]QKU34328.1 Rab family GTPase [Tupanvirus deep ocean]
MNTSGNKIVLIGDSGVGKSSLVYWFMYGKSTPMICPTIGAAFCTKEIIHRGNKIKFNIWDTAGQERFRSLVKMYYKGTYGCICVFDITNKSSFLNLDYWINDYTENCSEENLKIIIVANKCDYDKSEWCVDEEDIKKIADKYNCDYILTSCINGQGVIQVFYKLADLISGTTSNPPLMATEKDNNQIVDLTTKYSPLRLIPWC